MWSRVAVVLLSTASCHAGLLGAGTGEGSCRAAPFRAATVKWINGCPQSHPCCSEYGYCQIESNWRAGVFRDCNGVSNGMSLPEDAIAAETAAAARGDTSAANILVLPAGATTAGAVGVTGTVGAVPLISLPISDGAATGNGAVTAAGGAVGVGLVTGGTGNVGFQSGVIAGAAGSGGTGGSGFVSGGVNSIGLGPGGSGFLVGGAGGGGPGLGSGFGAGGAGLGNGFAFSGTGLRAAGISESGLEAGGAGGDPLIGSGAGLGSGGSSVATSGFTTGGGSGVGSGGFRYVVGGAGFGSGLTIGSGFGAGAGSGARFGSVGAGGSGVSTAGSSAGHTSPASTFSYGTGAGYGHLANYGVYTPHNGGYTLNYVV